MNVVARFIRSNYWKIDKPVSIPMPACNIITTVWNTDTHLVCDVRFDFPSLKTENEKLVFGTIHRLLYACVGTDTSIKHNNVTHQLSVHIPQGMVLKIVSKLKELGIGVRVIRFDN